jgi:hypothetical protein
MYISVAHWTCCFFSGVKPELLPHRLFKFRTGEQFNESSVNLFLR